MPPGMNGERRVTAFLRYSGSQKDMDCIYGESVCSGGVMISASTTSTASTAIVRSHPARRPNRTTVGG